MNFILILSIFLVFTGCKGYVEAEFFTSSQTSEGATVLPITNCSHPDASSNAPFANTNEPGIDGLTESNSFLICTSTQYEAITALDFDRNFILGADIDLTGVNINKIGSVGIPFSAVFNGNGYTFSISGSIPISSLHSLNNVSIGRSFFSDFPPQKLQVNG